jgi:hypothetical protein
MRSPNERPRWLRVVAAAPLWPWAWLICFALVARVKLGFWPQYDRLDPKDLHLSWLDMPPLVNRDWSTFLIAIFSRAL